MKYEKILVIFLAFVAFSPSLAKAGDYFQVKVINEYFCVYITDPETLNLAYLDAAGVIDKIVAGTVKAGNDGYNQPWSWHLDPDSVTLPDVAMEICDGKPSFVENDLPYWLNKRFCPWHSDIIAVGCYIFTTTTTTTTTTTMSSTTTSTTTTTTTTSTPTCNSDGTHNIDNLCHVECNASINCSGRLPGEANTCCNGCYYTDVNNDDKVNIKDVYIVAKAYGSQPGYSNWNPIADINNDEKVDVKDYYGVQKKYGKDCIILTTTTTTIMGF